LQHFQFFITAHAAEELAALDNPLPPTDYNCSWQGRRTKSGVGGGMREKSQPFNKRWHGTVFYSFIKSKI
jgi:hypothetical protein